LHLHGGREQVSFLADGEDHPDDTGDEHRQQEDSRRNADADERHREEDFDHLACAHVASHVASLADKGGHEETDNAHDESRDPDRRQATPIPPRRLGYLDLPPDRLRTQYRIQPAPLHHREPAFGREVIRRSATDVGTERHGGRHPALRAAAPDGRAREVVPAILARRRPGGRRAFPMDAGGPKQRPQEPQRHGNGDVPKDHLVVSDPPGIGPVALTDSRILRRDMELPAFVFIDDYCRASQHKQRNGLRRVEPDTTQGMGKTGPQGFIGRPPRHHHQGNDNATDLDHSHDRRRHQQGLDRMKLEHSDNLCKGLGQTPQDVVVSVAQARLETVKQQEHHKNTKPGQYMHQKGKAQRNTISPRRPRRRAQPGSQQRKQPRTLRSCLVRRG